MKDSPKQQIEFFQNEVREILGKPPQYLIRWGISLYLLLFCMVIFLSATINYPVYINCSASISPLNDGQSVVIDPKNIVKQVFVNDGSKVQKDQNLILSENTLILSNIEGTVRFLKPIKEGYQSNMEETLLQIQPTWQDYKLIIDIPPHLINKINIGQRISFNVDSKVIDGTITSIPLNVSADGQYKVEASSEHNETFISETQSVSVAILIDNKKILYKILNL